MSTGKEFHSRGQQQNMNEVSKGHMSLDYVEVALEEQHLKVSAV